MIQKGTKLKIKRGLAALLQTTEPNFLIIGAQKAGTTSLHYYLNQHPRIIGSNPKEVRFFDRDENFTRGREWYRKNFVCTRNPLQKYLYFEATPEYLYRSKAANRIFQFNPKMKLIVLLREPVSRAYSAWNMYKDFLNRPSIPDILTRGYLENQANQIFETLYRDTFPSFEQVINLELEKIETGSAVEEPSFIRRGIYYPQLRKFLDLFGKENILVVPFKDLFGGKKTDCLNGILAFLRLPASDWSFLKDEPQNTRSYTEPISELTRSRLAEFFKPYNEQLFDCLGYLPNW